MSEFDYGTGRRKNATARTRLYAGNGAIEVNGRKVEDYFPRKTLQMIIRSGPYQARGQVRREGQRLRRRRDRSG